MNADTLSADIRGLMPRPEHTVIERMHLLYLLLTQLVRLLKFHPSKEAQCTFFESAANEIRAKAVREVIKPFRVLGITTPQKGLFTKDDLNLLL